MCTVRTRYVLNLNYVISTHLPSASFNTVHLPEQAHPMLTHHFHHMCSNLVRSDSMMFACLFSKWCSFKRKDLKAFAMTPRQSFLYQGMTRPFCQCNAAHLSE